MLVLAVLLTVIAPLQEGVGSGRRRAVPYRTAPHRTALRLLLAAFLPPWLMRRRAGLPAAGALC